MTELETSQALLVAARKLLTPEERWGQGEYYSDYDKHGQPQRFCLVGALRHCAGIRSLGSYNSPFAQAYNRLRAAVDQFPHQWNDAPGRTHEEVLRLLDETITQEAK